MAVKEWSAGGPCNVMLGVVPVWDKVVCFFLGGRLFGGAWV